MSLARLAARLTGVYAIGSVSQRLIELLLLPVYTLYLAPDEFAVVALLYLAVMLISQALTSPVSAALARFYHHPDYRWRRGELLGSLLLFTTGKGLLMAGGYWLCCGPLCQLLFGSTEHLPVARCFMPATFLLASSALMLQLLQFKEQAKFFVAVSLGGAMLSAGVTLYLLAVADAGPAAVAFGYVAGAALRTLLVLPAYVGQSRLVGNLRTLWEPLRYGYGLLIGGYAQFAIGAGDRFVMQVQSTLTNVGLYDLGYRLGSLLAFLLVDAVKRGVQPIILQYEDEPERLRQIVRTFANYYYVAATFCGLALALFAREAIMALASQQSFWAAWVIVPIVALAQVQHGLGDFLNMGLVMANRPLQISTNLVASAVVNIGLNFALIPVWGIMGAAFSTLASYVVWNALKAYGSLKHFDVRFDWHRLAHVTTVGIALFGAGLVPTLTLSLWWAVPLKLVVLASFPLALWATGYFTPFERRRLWELVRPPRVEEAAQPLKRAA